jgi:GT2 family glycosyltransferase
VTLSFIVPFHRNLGQLSRCLTAIRRAAPTAELLVVADTPADDPQRLVAASGARLLRLEGGPFGPAVARNRGAALARGDTLVFVDADVVVWDDAAARLEAALTGDEVSAVFGAYDEDPPDPGFVSQAKNLAHSFIHQRSSRDAMTFWAGLGAVRATAFRSVGGFDERFRQPSVEDIDLGYRLTGAGFRIHLDPSIRGTHLKAWTWWSALRTDLVDRGIPWTQLLYRYGAMRDDLNLTWRYRVSVVLAYLLAISIVATYWRPYLAAVAAGCAALLLWLDWDYYAFFARRRGIAFAARWFPLHVLHHLSNGIAFIAGSVLARSARWLPARVPGALPPTPWDVALGSAAAMTSEYPAALTARRERLRTP